jgi:dTMP kinase
VKRVLKAGAVVLADRYIYTALDYWESGMDLHLGEDMYESFVNYQTRLLGEFDRMVEAYGFNVIDASRPVEEVFEDLRSRIERLVEKNGY